MLKDKLKSNVYPDVLTPLITAAQKEFAELQPAIEDLEAATKHEEEVKARIAAAMLVVWIHAKRTQTFVVLKNAFQSVRGATDTIKFINLLVNGRYREERMAQAINEMASVIALLAPAYTLMQTPTVEEVLADINTHGTVSEIHFEYEESEKLKLLKEKEDARRKAVEDTTKRASDRGMSYDEYLEWERAEKQREHYKQNEPKRLELLAKLLAMGEILQIHIDAPDSTVFVRYEGKLVKLSLESSLTMLDAVATAE